jgi:phage shock protein PspC (stress-responsive transcriptional regulator)
MTRQHLRLGISGLAIFLLLLLGFLKLLGIDQKLLRILMIAAGLLVGMLLITYRAFANVAEAARQQAPNDLNLEDKK